MEGRVHVSLIATEEKEGIERFTENSSEPEFRHELQVEQGPIESTFMVSPVCHLKLELGNVRHRTRVVTGLTILIEYNRIHGVRTTPSSRSITSSVKLLQSTVLLYKSVEQMQGQQEPFLRSCPCFCVCFHKIPSVGLVAVYSGTRPTRQSAFTFIKLAKYYVRLPDRLQQVRTKFLVSSFQSFYQCTL